MAEQDNLSFDNIINELYRVDVIEKENSLLKEKVEEQAAVIDKLGKDTQEVKEKAGIEESGKEKNVIGSEKLPATLTTSERRRYQNIGKEFIDGAGAQFQKILKGVKFKSMMSTMREKFTAGIDKIKGFVKKAKEKKWFFAKLILIATLLGVIIHHFKEKILNVIPNLGDYISELFKKGKAWVSDSISDMMDWVKNKMGDFISDALRQTFSYMKTAVSNFFSFTLPDAIVNLYLHILSAFSDDAAQELISEEDKKILAQQAANQADEVEEQIQFQENAERNDTAYIRSIYDELINTNSKIDDYRFKQLRDDIGLLMFDEKSADTSLFNELNSLIKGSGVEIEDINKLIQQGKFNPTEFLRLIEGVKENGITREEAYAAFKGAITDSNITSKMKDYVAENNEKNKNSLMSSSETLINMANDANKRIETIAAKKSKFEEEAKQIQNAAKEKMTSIDAANVIETELQNALKSLVDAITDFLNGDKIAESIKTSLDVTNNNFVEFFGKIKIFIENSFNYVEKFFNEQHSYLLSVYKKLENIIKELQLTDEQKEKIKNEKINEKVPSTFAIAVSVIFPPNNEDVGISQLIHDVVSIDLYLNTTVKAANGYLGRVIEILGDVELSEEQKINVNLQDITDEIAKLQKVDQALAEKDGDLQNQINKINKSTSAGVSDDGAERACSI